MVLKARENCDKLKYKNVEFVLGDIEDMPFTEKIFDVVISNCVLNLVPDKTKAFREIFRVLKPGGHFCVSDVVIKGRLSEKMKKDAEMYA
ncbi:MAG: methyltransferase domain-containing protein [Bacteroidales bacterium]|nr:methyltransferase domain-containing protein [Bacteroidales bacterium]